MSLARLVGANKQYIEQQIAHLSSLMVPSIDELLDQCEVIVVGNQGEEFVNALSRTRPDHIVIDLVKLKMAASELPAGYQGLCW